jgi:hypothetical protein
MAWMVVVKDFVGINLDRTNKNIIKYMSNYISVRRKKRVKVFNCCNFTEVIYLLEASNYGADLNIYETLQYYWNKYPTTFVRGKIVYTDVYNNAPTLDTTTIINNNINYLNQYYNSGSRFFVGFSRSTILNGVLSWFSTHSDATGLSLSSSAASLSIPKPIYRIQPPDTALTSALATTLTNANYIYYLYSDGEIASVSLLNYLQTTYSGKIRPYAVNSTLDLPSIQNYFTFATANDVSIMYLYNGTQQDDYLNLFTSGYNLPIETFDIANDGISIANKAFIYNKYNYLSYQSLCASKLFIEGLTAGGNKFMNTVPNALLMISEFYKGNGVNTLPSHNSTLQFDENNDLLYYSVLNQKFNSSFELVNNFMFFNDPIIGTYTLLL